MRYNISCPDITYDIAGNNCFYPEGEIVCFSSTTCSGPCTFTVPQNSTVRILALQCNNSPIAYNAEVDTTTCPSNSYVYCDDSYCSGGFTFNAGTGTSKDVAVTVYVLNQGYGVCGI